MIELKHLNFGFELTDIKHWIEPKRPSLDLLKYSSNRLEHHFWNIKRTPTCSSFGNRTQTPFFWLRTIKHRTLNIVWPITTKNYLLHISSQAVLNRKGLGFFAASLLISSGQPTSIRLITIGRKFPSNSFWKSHSLSRMPMILSSPSLHLLFIQTKKEIQVPFTTKTKWFCWIYSVILAPNGCSRLF